MSTPLYSQRWHQVAALKPRWRAHARCDRQTVRGETWFVVQGDGRAQSLRLDALAWLIAGRCDGRATLAEIWAAAVAEAPERAPTQDQTLDLVARLIQERCLECDGMPDVAVLRTDDDQRRRRARWARLNPLAPRVGLGDPTPWLRSLAPWGRWLFGPGGAAAWLVLMLAALGIAITESAAITYHAQTWLHAPRYVLLAWIVWVPMKAVHELAHALAVMRWGGQVREAGISFMVGWPVPYVDAAAADRFALAHQRALVSAAGILAELALAALGLMVWWLAEPGWLRDGGFAMAAAGMVSTLLFNGNPLLRMDGYFVLCDAAGLPNLAMRSAAWWRAVWQRALGWTQAPTPRLAPRERPWLVAYAPLAWAWRCALMTTLAWWAATWHPWLAYGVLLMAAVGLVGRPLYTVLRGPSQAGVAWALRGRFHARVLGVSLVLLLAVLVVPLPDRTVAMAVVQPPEDTLLRARGQGVVQQVRAEGLVTADEAVLELDDPVLRQDWARLQQQQAGAEAQWMAALRVDPGRAAQAQLSLQGIEAALAQAETRLSNQVVRARVPGQLAWERGPDWPGAFVQEGDVLGRVLDGRPPRLRVVLDQDEAARARLSPPRAVSVRWAEHPGQVVPGRLLRHVPAAISVLPGAALSDRMGGSVPVDPTDEEGLRPAYPTYVLEVAVEWPADQVPRAGGRAWVRLDYGAASLAQQGMRWVRQTLRARVDDQGT